MINKNASLILFFFLFFFAAAYTGAETVDYNTSSLSEKDTGDNLLLDVKYMKQEHMGCSRTAFAMVMHYYDPSITLEMVERDAPRAPDGGSENRFMALLTEQYGFKTHAFPGTIEGLIQLLKSGKPVIVAQYPSLTNKKSNHDRVVVGFDKTEQVLFVHDSAEGGNIPYSYEKFLTLWDANVGMDNKYFSILITKEGKEFKETGSITVDGMDADWEGIESFSPDRADDTDKGDLPLNIRDVYCYRDESFLYIKINFIGQPKSNPHVNYIFDFFYLDKGASRLKQLNFRRDTASWIQNDTKNQESITGFEWKLGSIFEAKVGMENFKGLPDIVSVRAGVYDIKRKKFIDMSYPNALRIR